MREAWLALLVFFLLPVVWAVMMIGVSKFEDWMNSSGPQEPRSR